MIKSGGRHNLYEEVSEKIIDYIEQGKWVPGEKLPGEMDLSKKFEVSRNSIRESIKALELMGIITSRPGKGTYVANEALRNIHNLKFMSMIENNITITELMETRLMIEPQLIYKVAKSATDADKERLKSIVDIAEHEFREKLYALDIGMEFHEEIARIADNKLIISFLQSINGKLIAQRGKVIWKHHNPETLIEQLSEHRILLNYIINGEADKAQKMMYNHIKESIKILLIEEQE